MYGTKIRLYIYPCIYRVTFIYTSRTSRPLEQPSTAQDSLRIPLVKRVYETMWRTPREVQHGGCIQGVLYGPYLTQGWVCTSAAINHTTAHMHGHHEATSGLAWPSLRRNLRALRLYHTASVRCGLAPSQNSVKKTRTDRLLRQ